MFFVTKLQWFITQFTKKKWIYMKNHIYSVVCLVGLFVLPYLSIRPWHPRLKSQRVRARASQENHAHFDVPGGSDGGAGACLGSGATEQTLAELRELHRDGEKATTLGLRHLDFFRDIGSS